MSFETTNPVRRWFLNDEDALNFLKRYGIKQYDKYTVVEYARISDKQP